MAIFLDGRGNLKGKKISVDEVVATTVTATSFVGSLAGAPVLPTYTVAQLSTGTMIPSLNTGRLVRCSDGDSGANCLAISNGTNWVRIVLGAAVASS